MAHVPFTARCLFTVASGAFDALGFGLIAWDALRAPFRRMAVRTATTR